MNVKAGVVLAGYAAAIGMASAAVAVRQHFTRGVDTQGGMYAFGDLSLFLAVFTVAALVPTCAALVFLRSHRGLWTALAVVAVAVAASGLAAVAVYVLGRATAGHSVLATWAGLAPLRILAAPLLAVVCLVAGLISPYRSSRVALIGAAVAEAAVSAYAAFAWFIPLYLR